MKKIKIMMLTAAVLFGGIAPEAAAGEFTARTGRVWAGLEMRDQFNAEQSLIFPSNRVTLLTIADRKGADQIAAWIEPIKQRFGNQIDVRGLADVSSVPGPFRGMVRKKFQKLQSYPVMMDWSGQACASIGYQPGAANLVVFGRDGTVQARFAGEAHAPALAELCAALEKILAPVENVAERK
jgi:hypothetical protein